MRRGSFHGKLVRVIFMVVGAIALFGLGTMLLWNALLPALFGLTSITFLQACGLLVLARLLFGSHLHALMFLGGGRDGGSGRMHGRFHERWNRMSPEERKQFRDRFQNAGFEFWGRGLDIGDEPSDRKTEEERSS